MCILVSVPMGNVPATNEGVRKGCGVSVGKYVCTR